VLANPIIFSGNGNKPLSEKICNYLKKSLSEVEIMYFSDGEIWVKYCRNIRGADVFVVQSTDSITNERRNITELLIMIDAARRASAERVTAVIPYFGYARQDRKDQPRVSITAKLMANLITIAGADRILTMDLHAPQIQGFFDIPVDNLYSSKIFIEHFQDMHIENLTVVSPDTGGITLARAYAKALSAPLAIIDKRRPKHNEAAVFNIIGIVQGRNILIIDDIVDTAETLCKAATALKEKGGENIYVACTHPVLSGNAVQSLQESPISKLMVSDTVDPVRVEKMDKIGVLTSAAQFGEAIRRIHQEDSISSLFD
jgi:ribose-phosphate pyrophosphokinase